MSRPSDPGAPAASVFRRCAGPRVGRGAPLPVALAFSFAVSAAFAGSCATAGTGESAGNDEKPEKADEELMKEVGGKAKWIIVWSSGRLGNHDLFVMNTDGSNVHPITHGDPVDWFPRFSPDGKRILFTRSKKGWVFERDANTDGKWDIYTVTPEGKDEKKVVDNASWGSWISDDEIVYARSTAIVRRKLDGGDETVLVDSSKVPELDGALLQQPEMSKDERFIAITLRGSKRETGIWNVKEKTWTRTGEGCQINWSPSGKEVYWVHPTGNGGSRVLHMPISKGKAAKSDSDLDAITLIDIPGRRSHEYFPQLSSDGHWLTWAATQRGHDHDTADYEIYIWEVGTPADKAARLTFHSANDRWPDIFLGGGASDSKPEGKAAADEESGAAAETKAAPAAEADESSGGNDSDAASSAGPSKSATGSHKKKKKSKKKH